MGPRTREERDTCPLEDGRELIKEIVSAFRRQYDMNLTFRTNLSGSEEIPIAESELETILTALIDHVLSGDLSEPVLTVEAYSGDDFRMTVSRKDGVVDTRGVELNVVEAIIDNADGELQTEPDEQPGVTVRI